MDRYALLVAPAFNRVYAAAAPRLLSAELGVAARTVLRDRLHDLTQQVIAGVPYLTFASPGLSARDADYIANLSSAFALFELRDGLLAPIELRRLDRFDDDLITIQKYVGKTNEHFTKLLLNITVFSSAFAAEMLDRPLRVLDPLCGRGTTLNQALMYGYHAAGVEIDARHVEAYLTFISTWLKDKRIKHRLRVTPLRRDRRLVARRLDVQLGLTKEAFKAGDVRELSVVNADTTRAADFLPARSFDVIVADAPYGVRHGSRERGDALSRRPLELLAAALPGWVRLLRPGGAVGLSWNTHVARREDVAKVMAENGLMVAEDGPYLQFRHRVDQAITRDVIVGRLPV